MKIGSCSYYIKVEDPDKEPPLKVIHSHSVEKYDLIMTLREQLTDKVRAQIVSENGFSPIDTDQHSWNAKILFPLCWPQKLYETGILHMFYRCWLRRCPPECDRLGFEINVEYKGMHEYLKKQGYLPFIDKQSVVYYERYALRLKPGEWCYSKS